MTEAELFQKLKRATPKFHWQRHEDKLVSGIPDASYGYKNHGGWVELKTYNCWPRNPDKPLKFTDLKPTQVNWAVDRGKAQGSVWFLVTAGEDWFLISWRYARQLGVLTRSELLEASDIHGSGAISKDIVGVFHKT